MIAQWAQNNIFVREWILQVKLSKSCMDHNRLDSRQEDKKTQFEENNTPWSNLRTKCSYIHSSLSKYKMFPFSFVCFSSDSIPHFSYTSFLYIVLFLFNLSFPPVDCISDLLDACPIKALLNPLCVTVRLNITVQTSFPHKCSQFVRCRTFNVVVAAFILDFSRFTVDSFIWSLFLEVWYPPTQYSLGDWAPIPHNASRGILGRQLLFIITYPCPRPIALQAYLTVWPSSGYPTSSSMAHGPILLFGSFFPTVRLKYSEHQKKKIS